MQLNFAVGNKISYEGEVYSIKQGLDLHYVLLEEPVSGVTVVAKICNIKPVEESLNNNKPHQELTLISAQDWEIAKYRESIIKPLVKQRGIFQQAKQVGKLLNITERQVYNLVNRYRASGYQLLSLVPEQSKGGVGKGRLVQELEQIINHTIKKLYLNTQKVKISKIIEEVKLCCFKAKLQAPSVCTIRRRLNNYGSVREIVAKREGAKKAKNQYTPVPGSSPETDYPLQIYQIDHTVVDLIIVDEVYRQPIGRPYITVAIDVFSRCIAGFCLTLEPPSAVSVGLCLTHAVFDKDIWLTERNIETDWPIWGKPECIYVDNGKEFHSEALIKGCEAHGIKIEYRPIGKAHYGGIVERVIGTLMELIHQIPGTTFSNVKERGNYDSEGKAILTLRELEKWLTIAITQYYHKKQHAKLLKPPIEQYKEGVLGSHQQASRGYPPKMYYKQGFLIDFLPIVYRSIQRNGFTLDQINYYDNVLSPLIADRSRYDRFLIRRDPRDLSKIFVLEPKRHIYMEVPYGTLSRSTISLWEHRQALKYLKTKGASLVDEPAIFRAIEQLREIAKEACKTSKAARRQCARQPGSNVDLPEKAQDDDISDDLKHYKVEIW